MQGRFLNFRDALQSTRSYHPKHIKQKILEQGHVFKHTYLARLLNLHYEEALYNCVVLYGECNRTVHLQIFLC